MTLQKNNNLLVTKGWLTMCIRKPRGADLICLLVFNSYNLSSSIGVLFVASATSSTLLWLLFVKWLIDNVLRLSQKCCIVHSSALALRVVVGLETLFRLTLIVIVISLTQLFHVLSAFLVYGLFVLWSDCDQVKELLVLFVLGHLLFDLRHLRLVFSVLFLELVN